MAVDWRRELKWETTICLVRRCVPDPVRDAECERIMRRHAEMMARPIAFNMDGSPLTEAQRTEILAHRERFPHGLGVTVKAWRLRIPLPARLMLILDISFRLKVPHPPVSRDGTVIKTRRAIG